MPACTLRQFVQLFPTFGPRRALELPRGEERAGEAQHTGAVLDAHTTGAVTPGERLGTVAGPWRQVDEGPHHARRERIAGRRARVRDLQGHRRGGIGRGDDQGRGGTAAQVPTPSQAPMSGLVPRNG